MEYTQITDKKDLIGKTIKKAESTDWVDNNLVIVFTDNTYFHIEADADYDGAPELYFYNEPDLSLESEVRLGFITEQEAEQIREQEAAEQKAITERQALEREQMERATYEILKKKYGE